MEQVNSIQIKQIGLNLAKIGDFLYHECPLLSLYIDKRNENDFYFYKWTDCDEVCNRWLIFCVTIKNLKGFLWEDISLKQLIYKNEFMFLIDLDDNLAQKQCSIIASKDLPSSYLPADNSFYKAEKYTELAEEYKQKLIHAEETEANVLSFLLNEITQIKQEQKRENELISQILKVISH